jgi:hypothetical protein
MTRLIAAAVLLTAAAAPAFACELEKSASTDTQKRAVASQPNTHQTPLPPRTTTDRKSS